MKVQDYDSGNMVFYDGEAEVERAVDATLRTMGMEGNEDTQNLLSGLEEEENLRDVALKHLSYELERTGEVGDYRVAEVVEGYASAESKWETPALDEGVEE